MKKKILIGYTKILHYRIPLFNYLGNKYDVTVLHSGDKVSTKGDKFIEIIVPAYKIGPFSIQPKLLKEVRKTDYDAIVLFFDVAWITTLLSVVLKYKKSKIILWGAWLTQNKIANLLRIQFSKLVDANIFYTYKTLKDFQIRNVKKEVLYVANNTFDVEFPIKSFEYHTKNKILFVGSLDDRKQNDLLIKAFKNILPKIPANINLTIIGDGVNKRKLENLVQELSLTKRVDFLGRINSAKKLREYYQSAIVSVSFGQAGLSVLQSFGYGVPFLTKNNAISGGEIYNIKNNYNGVLVDDDQTSLEDNLMKLSTNISFARKLGENAFDYYQQFCTINNMAQGFIDAIENTNQSKNDTE